MNKFDFRAAAPRWGLGILMGLMVTAGQSALAYLQSGHTDLQGLKAALVTGLLAGIAVDLREWLKDLTPAPTVTAAYVLPTSGGVVEPSVSDGKNTP